MKYVYLLCVLLCRSLADPVLPRESVMVKEQSSAEIADDKDIIESLEEKKLTFTKDFKAINITTGRCICVVTSTTVPEKWGARIYTNGKLRSTKKGLSIHHPSHQKHANSNDRVVIYATVPVGISLKITAGKSTVTINGILEKIILESGDCDLQSICSAKKITVAAGNLDAVCAGLTGDFLVRCGHGTLRLGYAEKPEQNGFDHSYPAYVDVICGTGNLRCYFPSSMKVLQKSAFFVPILPEWQHKEYYDVLLKVVSPNMEINVLEKEPHPDRISG